MEVTGWKGAGTAVNAPRGDKTDWFDMNNAKVDDNDYAFNVPGKPDYGDWLRLTDFGFGEGDIPSGSTIDGIEVQYKRVADFADFINDSAMYLRKTSGQVGDNNASATKWATSKETATYGASDDKWGTTWAESDIVDNSDFGIDLSIYNSDDELRCGWVYYCQIRIYYTAPAADHRKSSFFKMF